VSIRPDDIAPSDEQSTALFRIFQEALTNAYRHASASEIWADLRRRGARLSLTIRDNGKGITETRACDPNSFGLYGIRERVRQLGGRFTIEGQAGKGTTLSVNIPLETAGGANDKNPRG
jgi:signal transduction histidine kinase